MSGANHSAEIVRVLDSVENHVEAALRSGFFYAGVPFDRT
jgi:hypothetical protein